MFRVLVNSRYSFSLSSSPSLHSSVTSWIILITFLVKRSQSEFREDAQSFGRTRSTHRQTWRTVALFSPRLPFLLAHQEIGKGMKKYKQKRKKVFFFFCFLKSYWIKQVLRGGEYFPQDVTAISDCNADFTCSVMIKDFMNDDFLNNEWFEEYIQEGKT